MWFLDHATTNDQKSTWWPTKIEATKIFSSSKEKHGLCCTSFYGDGGNKAYPAVKDVFGLRKPIKKFECVGHYQYKFE